MEWLGKTIGRVRIEKLLARGGMADVYLGTHLTLERPVAVKLLHNHIEEQALLERFHREARVIARLRHPNIVQIFDFDTVDGHPYIVMEYLKVPTLANYLRGLHNRGERIPLHQVARSLKELTAAIDYAHAQGVIHQDITPGNILLHKKKAEEIPLDKPLTNDVEAIVKDFGLVRIAHVVTQTASGMVTGTPAYMSPEQALGEKTDHRTDIYSLGVVLYEMLAGRVPFEADSTLSVIYMHIHTTPPPILGIDPAVQAILNRALAKKPEDRYQSSSDMAVDFFLAIGAAAQAETMLRAAEERLVSEKVATERKAEKLAARPALDKAVIEARSPAPKYKKRKRGEQKKTNQNETKLRTKSIKTLETSIAYPKLLSKRLSSKFVLQYYLPQQVDQVTRNIRAAFQNPKVNEYRQSSSVKLRQKITVKFFSHAFNFSEPVTKVMDQQINIFRFLGTPKDNCEPGSHDILISIADSVTGQEIESMTIIAEVVDFAFDHISRPWLSRISATILGIGSFVMFLLGLLQQIDKTIGLTSGTAAGVLAVLVYGNFYNLYQRIRPITP